MNWSNDLECHDLGGILVTMISLPIYSMRST